MVKHVFTPPPPKPKHWCPKELDSFINNPNNKSVPRDIEGVILECDCGSKYVRQKVARENLPFESLNDWEWQWVFVSDETAARLMERK